MPRAKKVVASQGVFYTDKDIDMLIDGEHLTGTHHILVNPSKEEFVLKTLQELGLKVSKNG